MKKIIVALQITLGVLFICFSIWALIIYNFTEPGFWLAVVLWACVPLSIWEEYVKSKKSDKS